MFAYLTNVEKLDLSKLDTSYITNMSRMFYNSSGLKSINLSNFNTSNVTSMNYMFSECNNLLSLDLSNFDTSKVTAMVGMFQNDTNLSSINFGSDFNTEKVTTMIAMFSLCKKLSYIDLSEFNTSNVTNMQSMFYYCESLQSFLNFKMLSPNFILSLLSLTIIYELIFAIYQMSLEVCQRLLTIIIQITIILHHKTKVHAYYNMHIILFLLYI